MNDKHRQLAYLMTVNTAVYLLLIARLGVKQHNYSPAAQLDVALGR